MLKTGKFAEETRQIAMVFVSIVYNKYITFIHLMDYGGHFGPSQQNGLSDNRHLLLTSSVYYTPMIFFVFTSIFGNVYSSGTTYT